ncbi:hypothetical protein AH06_00615 [candidate division TM6 bacterium Zodletone_IIa]|nr:hypothetical protein AH06_00615 [candidate division TM6 bacterium Zodletone_IIa]
MLCYFKIISNLKTSQTISKDLKVLKKTYFNVKSEQNLEDSENPLVIEIVNKLDKQINSKDKKWILEESIEELFEPITKTYIKEFSEDSFPRFLETKEAKNLLFKYFPVEDFETSKQVYEEFNDLYFKDAVITDNDFEVAKQVVKRKDWVSLNDYSFIYFNEKNVKTYS